MTTPSPGLPLDVGIDVGGTTITVAVVAADGRVEGSVDALTPEPALGAAVLEDVLVDAVLRVCAGRTPTRVGLAAAAFVDPSRQYARFAPHLAWRDAPVARTLSDRLGAPVLLENDAACAAWGEARVGAAAGASSSVTVTVGTGIGGGIVLGDHLVRGANGMAGEFGHVRVAPDGPACPCGGNGCWERYVSAAALVAATQRRRRDGGRAWTPPEVVRAAEAGDPAALGAFDEVGAWLGRGLASVVATLDPAVVVVGGGVAAAGELLLAPARAELSREVVGAGHRTVPDVVASRLGSASGLVGAVLLARETFPVG